MNEPNTTNNIYREELLELVRNPINKGSIQNPDLEVTKNNPMCGDTITVQLSVEDGVIKDIKFDGQSCAVTTISSSLASEHLIGKTTKEVMKFSKDDLLELLNLNLTTSRIKCANLFLDAVKSALSET